MIGSIDMAICIAYILGILALGLWAGLKKKKQVSGNESSEYFMAGKSVRWPMIGLALFATNISCLHLVSLAQSGFDTGLVNGNFEWMAGITLIILVLFFIPFYIKSGVSTLPDFLERRYNTACRDWLTVISILSAIVIHIAFSFLAGGIVLRTLFGVNLYTSVIVIAVITGMYTILGGLRAVMITESVQTVVLLGGAFIITAICFQKSGGWTGITETLESTGNSDKISMLRPLGDPSGLSWLGVLVGYPVIGIWYWCADQTIVQRVLGAKDENHAKAGALFCGFIKILPVFIFVLPGLMAFVLMKKGLFDVSSITNSADGSTKGIYTLMITQLVPKGLAGILAAALISGLMSQISGALNSIATLFSYDLYKRKYPEASDAKLVSMGRISGAVALVVSISLLPLINQYESLFNGVQDVIAHMAPPITTVFLLGVFWSKASAKSAQYTLWIGSLLGAIVFIVNKTMPGSVMGNIPFMMMAFYLFTACVMLQVVLSYVFPVQHTAESNQLYWQHWREPLQAKGWPGLADYRVLSFILLGILMVLYVVFR
jgi:solute:Na+ symporter, SSS family